MTEYCYQSQQVTDSLGKQLVNLFFFFNLPFIRNLRDVNNAYPQNYEQREKFHVVKKKTGSVLKDRLTATLRTCPPTQSKDQLLAIFPLLS